MPDLRIPALDYELVNAARRILENSLGLVPGERVLIVVDTVHRELGVVLIEVARLIGADGRLYEIEKNATRPVRSMPLALRDALADVEASVLLVSDHEGEVLFRRELVGAVPSLRIRHAHMVGVSRGAIISGFAVDPVRVANATRAVRMRFRPDSTVRLRSPSGSDLEVRLTGAHRWVEQVGVIRSGRWENLPSGELLTCPGDVRGVFVADASVGGAGVRALGLLGDIRAVRFEIEGGFCRQVRCDDRALQRELDEALRRERNASRVGGLLFGTNVGILRATGEILCDQHLPGLHLSFGTTFAEETGASWDARTQLVATATLADVDVDGVALLRAGRYLVI